MNFQAFLEKGEILFLEKGETKNREKHRHKADKAQAFPFRYEFPEKPKKERGQNIKGKIRLTKEMRLRVAFLELTRIPGAFWKRPEGDHVDK